MNKRRIFNAVQIAMAIFMGAAAQNVAAAVPQWQRVELGGAAQNYPFALYSNRLWQDNMSAVKSAVMVFHGMGRNGAGYYAEAEKLLRASGADAAATLLLAPNYFATADASSGKIDGLPQWRDSRWNRGEDAVNWPWPLSSFQPIDDLLAELMDRRRFPGLERVVVAGHSAGGQLVHRYAVLNGLDEKVRASGKSLTYIVANPSSYMYFNQDRPVAAGFAPFDSAACPAYNRYRYGVETLPRYAGIRDGAALFRRYAARDVAYFLGTADNDPRHHQLDQACGARAQGSHRLERGRNYLRYERQLAGPGEKISRRAFEVIGVAHDQARMFGSKCAAELLFGIPGEKNADGAACRAPQ